MSERLSCAQRDSDAVNVKDFSWIGLIVVSNDPFIWPVKLAFLKSCRSKPKFYTFYLIGFAPVLFSEKLDVFCCFS